jgi:hypothetical protein
LRSSLPVATLAILLLVATWYEGAFALRYWAPVAILGLVAVAAATIGGGLGVRGRSARVAIWMLWAFAAWSVLSAFWAESPVRALEGGGRTLLYAALFTVALTAPIGGLAAARVGRAIVAGVAAIAAIALVELLAGGADEFLAGRLDAPVGYRNATACLFGLAFWPLVATGAHRAANPLLRGFAFAAAVLVLGLVFMTAARGIVLGLVVGGVVALALGPDRLRRAWVALAACAGLALVTDELLTPYRAFTAGEPESVSDIAVAVDALLLVVLTAIAVGVVGAMLDRGLRLSPRMRAAGRRTGTATIAVLAAAGVVVTIATIGDPVRFTQDRVEEFRGLETAAPGDTRLTFGERPLVGVGEGNYRFGYYEERRTDRNVSTPHSLALRLLAENGAIGALALLMFLAAVAAAVAKRWRAAVPEVRWVASGLLAGAAVVLGQGAVDWIWLVPGVMGLAFVLLGLGVATLAPSGDGDRSRVPRLGGRLVAGLLAAVAALGVAALYLADADVRRARAADATAVERLDRARAAERLNRWSVTPRYLQAGALEELGRTREVRRELLAALDLEPANFVTLGLLGDFELRQGHDRAARRWYRRALARNPLDEGLRQLARSAGR